jgi:hypothetical protein
MLPADDPNGGRGPDMSADSLTAAMSAALLAVSTAVGPVAAGDGQSGVTVVQSQVVQVACDGPSCTTGIDVPGGMQAVNDSLHRLLADLVGTADGPAPWELSRLVGLRIVLMHF